MNSTLVFNGNSFVNINFKLNIRLTMRYLGVVPTRKMTMIFYKKHSSLPSLSSWVDNLFETRVGEGLSNFNIGMTLPADNIISFSILRFTKLELT